MNLRIKDYVIVNSNQVLMKFTLEIGGGSERFRIFDIKLINDISKKKILSFHKYLTDDCDTYEVIYPTSSKLRDRILALALEVYNEKTT